MFQKILPLFLFLSYFFSALCLAESVKLDDLNLTLEFQNIPKKQQKQLVRIVRNAYKQTAKASQEVEGLKSGKNGVFSAKKKLFQKSFGSSSATTLNQVSRNLNLLKERFSGKFSFKARISVHPGRAAYDFTHSSQARSLKEKGEKPIVIYLYALFWQGAHQERLLIHELSHVAFHSKDGFDLNGDGNISKSETIYGLQDSRKLAAKHPHFAVQHADTYSFYIIEH